MKDIEIYFFGSIFIKNNPNDIDVLLIFEELPQFEELERIKLYLYKYFGNYFEIPIHLTVFSKDEEQELSFLNKSKAKRFKKEILSLVTLFKILGEKLIDEALSKALSNIGESVSLAKFYKVIFKETFNDYGFSSNDEWNYFKIWLRDPTVYQKMINQFVMVPDTSDQKLLKDMIDDWEKFALERELDLAYIELGKKSITSIISTLKSVVTKLFSLENKLLLNRVTELNISINEDQVNKESKTLLKGIANILETNSELLNTFGPKSMQMAEMPIETSQLWLELRISTIEPNNQAILKKIDYLVADDVFTLEELEIINQFKMHTTLFSINRRKQAIDSNLYKKFPTEFVEVIKNKIQMYD